MPLSDLEAWKMCNAENAARRKLSPFERGVLLEDGFRNHCSGSIDNLIVLSGLARASVSRYLAVARWPAKLVEAFQSPVSISVEAIGILNPLLKDCRVSMLKLANRRADSTAIRNAP